MLGIAKRLPRRCNLRNHDFESILEVEESGAGERRLGRLALLSRIPLQLEDPRHGLRHPLRVRHLDQLIRDGLARWEVTEQMAQGRLALGTAAPLIRPAMWAFGGHTEVYRGWNGGHERVRWIPGGTCDRHPPRLCGAGYQVNHLATAALWRLRPPKNFDFLRLQHRAIYGRRVQEKVSMENLSKVASYPQYGHRGGPGRLRLKAAALSL